MIEKTCLQCEKEFKVFPCRKDAKFCSNKCKTRYKNLTDNPAKRLGIGKKISDARKREIKLGIRKTVFQKGNQYGKLNKGRKRPDLVEYNKKFKSKQIKKLWQNQEYREKVIKNSLKSLFKRPTSLEKEFIKIIEKYNLSFKYCGDGRLMIGYRCPDFYEINGKKICIEVANKTEKEVHRKISWKDYEKKRIEHFAKYGWKCLVFFADKKNKFDIPEEEIVKKIKEVIK